MNVAPSSPSPVNGGQAALWWICIRMLLLFTLAFLPVVGAGIFYFIGLREKAMAEKEVERCEITEPIADVEE